MFRALSLYPAPTVASPHGTPYPQAIMEAPLSVTLFEEGKEAVKQAPNKPVELAVAPDAIFTTAVGHSSKRTLARWHVGTPQEVVEHMLDIFPPEAIERPLL